MNKLIRTIHPEVRVIDAKKGIVDYIASDETLDSYREIIRAAGWKFTRFNKNAPFVDSHDYNTIGNLLGKVIDFKVTGKQLVERVQWAIDSNSELAKLGWSLTTGGYLKAVSVGFFPVRMATKWDSDQSNFVNAVAELKLTAEQAAQLRAIYLDQEQIELSACIIGANPNALAKAHIDGAVTDATLAKLGFGDDDLSFLHESAAAYDQATLPQRALIRRELRGITSRKSRIENRESGKRSSDGTVPRFNGSRKDFSQETPHSAASSNNGGDDEEANHRQREGFLAELTKTLKS